MCEYIYIPVELLPSTIAFCFHLFLIVGRHEWEEELRKQKKIEVMLIIPSKWITRKILAARITEACIKARGREKSDRTAIEVSLKTPLGRVPHT